ncbi:MAG: transglutaminase-like domain-containing protein, partial [Acidobacteriota bacterium]
MRELWSREDERDLTGFLDAVRRDDLVGALFAIEGTPPVARRLAEALLDEAAAAVRERAAGTRSSFQKARLLARVLAEELGFAGDEDDYYDPRNVLLGPLLERRKGMPILLSVVWMEVGRRAGIPVAGIGLPGHFIVRVGPPPGTLADPFAGGVPLTVDDCRRKVKALAGGRVPWRAEYLRQMEIPALLERVLRNLSGCRGRTGDEAGQFRAVTFLSALRPDEPENLLSRAELAEELGVRGLAREVWAEIVERFPESAQAQAASEK